MSIGHHVWLVLLFTVCKMDQECETVPFSVVTVGAIGTRCVGQVLLWQPDLQGPSQQVWCGFSPGLGGAGAGGPEHSRGPGFPRCRLTSGAFSL